MTEGQMSVMAAYLVTALFGSGFWELQVGRGLSGVDSCYGGSCGYNGEREGEKRGAAVQTACK